MHYFNNVTFMYLCHFHLRLSFDVFKTFKILHFSNFTSFNPVISIYFPHSILIPEWSLNHFNSKCSALQGVAGSTHVFYTFALQAEGPGFGKEIQVFHCDFPCCGANKGLNLFKNEHTFHFCIWFSMWYIFYSCHICAVIERIL